MARFLTPDGVSVAAHDLGGDGPPLLFAHATGFHGMVFAPMATRLADRFHCWSFDMRHHGDATEPNDTGFAWEGFAEDTRAVVEGLGLDRPFAVGHSAGGAALLLTEAMWPGTFRALYCFEPIVPPVTPPPGPAENPLSEGARRRRETFPSRQAAYDNYASKPPFAVLHPDALRAYVDHGFADEPDGTVRLKCRPADEAEVYRMSFAHDAFGRLGLVGCPVVVACGADTDAIREELTVRQAAAIPSARTEILPGLGHFGPLEDPAAVADAVARAFLSG